MLIGELALKTGSSRRSLRYYEQKNFISSKRLPNGYRDYSEEQAERVRAVQFYLHLGLTSEKIEQTMNCRASGSPRRLNDTHTMCAPLAALYRERLTEVNEQITALTFVRQQLEARLENFGGTTPASSSKS